MAEWYRNLEPRERLVLLAGGLLALVLLGWLLVWQPLLTGNERLRAQVEERRAQQIWMARAGAELAMLRQRIGTGDARPLQERVSEATARAGLKPQRLQQSGDERLQLWLEDVPFADLLRLLDQFSRSGVRVEKASIRAGSPGRVEAQLRLVGTV